MIPTPTERKVLAITALLAGFLLVVPGERVGSIGAITFGALAGIAHVVLSRRERARSRPAPPGAPASASDA